ncbi:endolytic transglycosylase MltG [Catellatospora sp. NPDC049609]|uniref:endolytic transglycosylase MltG n=1 Tax=Catellatospora sp. NPDC049609 TaxID=3155505 RepID=UPI00341F062E
MTEEFFLAYGNEPEPYRPRRAGQQPPRRRKRKKRRGRTALALLLTMLLLGGVGVGLYLGYDRLQGMFGAEDYTSAADSAEVEVVIPEGASGGKMAKVLKAADVIASEQAFVDAWEANPDASDIQPGRYKLRLKLSAADAITMLLDPKNRIVNGITVAEGLSTFKIYKLLSQKLGIPEAEFKAAGADPVKLGVPATWFDRDGRKVTKSVEGFLFPDTYEFPKDVTAESALKMMVQRFLAVTKEMKFSENVRGSLDIAPYEALIVASLAQAESGTAKDLPKVARVAYNRIIEEPPSGICHCLEMDVTVNYWFETQGKPTKKSGDMTEAELDNPKNKYNRKLAFLPTPINNPGRAALAAAAKPAVGKWHFFVAIDKEGNSAFAVTNAEHERNKEIACERKIIC